MKIWPLTHSFPGDIEALTARKYIVLLCLYSLYSSNLQQIFHQVHLPNTDKRGSSREGEGRADIDRSHTLQHTAALETTDEVV